MAVNQNTIRLWIIPIVISCGHIPPRFLDDLLFILSQKPDRKTGQGTGAVLVQFPERTGVWVKKGASNYCKIGSKPIK